MKKINNLLAGSALLIAVFCNCEKVIEPKNLPQQDPRLVINSVITNDSTIRVNVSSSKSILNSKRYNFINNAVCDLYVNGLYAERMKSVDTSGNYRATQKGLANNQFSIKVSSSGFKDVEGTTDVPRPMIIVRVERYDTINNSFNRFNFNGSNSYSGSLKYKVYVRDTPGKKDYFSLKPVILAYDSARNIINLNSPSLNIYPNTTNNDNRIFSSGFTLEADDSEIINGNEIVLDFSVSLSFQVNRGPSVKSIDVLLLGSSASEDYYKYKITLSQQLTNGNGLFAEPVLVHNNIKNGMGLVGAINTSLFSMGKVIVKSM